MLIGRLGRDVEMRYTPKGTAVANFPVATSTGWGENKETVWFEVTVWGKLAENCNEYIGKGRLVHCKGELKTPVVFKRRNGESGTKLELTARTVTFLDKSSQEPRQSNVEESEIPF